MHGIVQFIYLASLMRKLMSAQDSPSKVIRIHFYLKFLTYKTGGRTIAFNYRRRAKDEILSDIMREGGLPLPGFEPVFCGGGREDDRRSLPRSMVLFS